MQRHDKSLIYKGLHSYLQMVITGNWKGNLLPSLWFKRKLHRHEITIYKGNLVTSVLPLSYLLSNSIKPLYNKDLGSLPKWWLPMLPFSRGVLNLKKCPVFDAKTPDAWYPRALKLFGVVSGYVSRVEAVCLWDYLYRCGTDARSRINTRCLQCKVRAPATKSLFSVRPHQLKQYP